MQIDVKPEWVYYLAMLVGQVIVFTWQLSRSSFQGLHLRELLLELKEDLKEYKEMSDTEHAMNKKSISGIQTTIARLEERITAHVHAKNNG